MPLFHGSLIQNWCQHINSHLIHPLEIQERVREWVLFYELSWAAGNGELICWHQLSCWFSDLKRSKWGRMRAATRRSRSSRPRQPADAGRGYGPALCGRSGAGEFPRRDRTAGRARRFSGKSRAAAAPLGRDQGCDPAFESKRMARIRRSSAPASRRTSRPTRKIVSPRYALPESFREVFDVLRLVDLVELVR